MAKKKASGLHAMSHNSLIALGIFFMVGAIGMLSTDTLVSDTLTAAIGGAKPIFTNCHPDNKALCDSLNKQSTKYAPSIEGNKKVLSATDKKFVAIVTKIIKQIEKLPTPIVIETPASTIPQAGVRAFGDVDPKLDELNARVAEAKRQIDIAKDRLNDLNKQFRDVGSEDARKAVEAQMKVLAGVIQNAVKAAQDLTNYLNTRPKKVEPKLVKLFSKAVDDLSNKAKEIQKDIDTAKKYMSTAQTIVEKSFKCTNAFQDLTDRLNAPLPQNPSDAVATQIVARTFQEFCANPTSYKPQSDDDSGDPLSPLGPNRDIILKMPEILATPDGKAKMETEACKAIAKRADNHMKARAAVFDQKAGNAQEKKARTEILQKESGAISEALKELFKCVSEK